MAQIRRAELKDVAGIARVHVDSWRSTYAGLVPAAFLAGLTYESRERRWQEILNYPNSQSGLFVAADETGRIVGFAVGGPERNEFPGYDGELYAIYLFEETQGLGLGRQLAQAVAGDLAERGFRSLLIWVLRDNQPARRFYERLGGVYVAEKDIEIGGATLKEVAYGWPELRVLVGNNQD